MGSLTEARPTGEDRGKRDQRTRKKLWMTDESSHIFCCIYKGVEYVDLTVRPNGNLAPGFFFKSY